MSDAVEPYYDGPEHRCELLVRIIQSRQGNPSKEEREEAMVELLSMFGALIHRIAKRTYKAYGHSLRVSYDEWHHDTVTEMINLVMSDYIPKRNGGKAMFAPYIQTKLHFRTLYRAQKTVRDNAREMPWSLGHGETYLDVMQGIGASTNVLRGAFETTISGQVEGAILEQLTTSDEYTFENFSQLQLISRVDHLRRIADETLDSEERTIWNGTLFSGMNLLEIASTLNETLPPNEKPWTKRRVYLAYHKVRTKVLAAYGEAALAGAV